MPDERDAGTAARGLGEERLAAVDAVDAGDAGTGLLERVRQPSVAAAEIEDVQAADVAEPVPSWLLTR
ncbi:hypothetical protein [Catenulispora sp. GP43]|uniref:hypothetical protein n=1 Tax=Catenulispora sp. GP43 TaxID=3156263 RepID=UPI003518A623